jgi:hypothetical protein
MPSHVGRCLAPWWPEPEGLAVTSALSFVGLVGLRPLICDVRSTPRKKHALSALWCSLDT